MHYFAPWNFPCYNWVVIGWWIIIMGRRSSLLANFQTSIFPFSSGQRPNPLQQYWKYLCMGGSNNKSKSYFWSRTQIRLWPGSFMMVDANLVQVVLLSTNTNMMYSNLPLKWTHPSNEHFVSPSQPLSLNSFSYLCACDILHCLPSLKENSLMSVEQLPIFTRILRFFNVHNSYWTHNTSETSS
jgi:hypothetical protein